MIFYLRVTAISLAFDAVKEPALLNENPTLHSVNIQDEEDTEEELISRSNSESSPDSSSDSEAEKTTHVQTPTETQANESLL
ncbi:hypothetical protein M1146_07410 [Patescibacteria group bacterium]|nr:hypothetical protein [Patescibacteria group bacterium]